jgi:hypothetical protein
MATLFSNTLLPDNSTDVHFQAWAMFFENALVTTGGWQISSDTGQTPPATLVHPTTANTKKGFRVYRLSDGGPIIYMRIDYGSSNAANTPGIWITIGSSTDGAGNIVAPFWNGGISSTPNVSAGSNVASGAFNSYASSALNRATIAMFVSTNPAYHMVFAIERTQNPSGNDTTDGLLLVYRDGQFSSNGMAQARYIANAGGTQPTAEQGLNYILTTKNPSETFGGDIGVGVISHFKGIAMQPGKNFLITGSSDVSAESTITMTLYNGLRTYVQLNALPPYKALSGSNVLDGNARFLMRYD